MLYYGILWYVMLYCYIMLCKSKNVSVILYFIYIFNLLQISVFYSFCVRLFFYRFFRSSFCCIFLFFNTFHNNIRTLKKKKHTKHRQTSHTHRQNRTWGGGYTTPQLYGANTPSRKKIKKFQKIKNSNVITYKITHCQN